MLYPSLVLGAEAAEFLFEGWQVALPGKARSPWSAKSFFH
jgi:hypothetical protein